MLNGQDNLMAVYEAKGNLRISRAMGFRQQGGNHGCSNNERSDPPKFVTVRAPSRLAEVTRGGWFR